MYYSTLQREDPGYEVVSTHTRTHIHIQKQSSPSGLFRLTGYQPTFSSWVNVRTGN